MTLSPPAARRILPAMALACIAVLATGCGPDDPAASSPDATSTAGVSATSAPGTTAPDASTAGGTTGGTPGSAPAATAAPGATSASNGGSAAAACSTRYLQASVGSSQGTAGSTYLVIDFKNLSQNTCTLYGYPGVSLAGGTPVTEIGPAATQSTAAPRRLVTLAPGAMGNATLQIVDAGNYSPGECQPKTATYLQVYPPNQTAPIYVGHTSPACAGHVRLLTVGVVEAGAGSAS